MIICWNILDLIYFIIFYIYLWNIYIKFLIKNFLFNNFRKSQKLRIKGDLANLISLINFYSLWKINYYFIKVRFYKINILWNKYFKNNRKKINWLLLKKKKNI